MLKGVLKVISPLNSYSTNYHPHNFTSAKEKQSYPPKRKLGYAHSLGTSALFGLSATGFSSIFSYGWKLPIAIGTAFAGIMMLFNIPDKIYERK